jgi:hypothetical protein
VTKLRAIVAVIAQEIVQVAADARVANRMLATER